VEAYTCEGAAFPFGKDFGREGTLASVSPCSHPQLAPIELLWRDMKYDYRVNWTHTRKNLITCITKWLARSDDEFISELRRLLLHTISQVARKR
jgi:hypothetical protein